MYRLPDMRARRADLGSAIARTWALAWARRLRSGWAPRPAPKVRGAGCRLGALASRPRSIGAPRDFYGLTGIAPPTISSTAIIL